MPPPDDEIHPGSEGSISDVILRYAANGHSHDLMAMSGGRLRCTTCGLEGPASDGHVEAFRRFEGASDPDDMCIVAAVFRQRPNGGDCRGVLMVGFGPTASPEDNEAFASLQLDSSSRTMNGADSDRPPSQPPA